MIIFKAICDAISMTFVVITGAYVALLMAAISAILITVFLPFMPILAFIWSIHEQQKGGV